MSVGGSQDREAARRPGAASGAALDRLVERLVASGPLRFAVAGSQDERDAAFRLRHDAVVSRGWASPRELDGGREHDPFDATAVHVVGWDGTTPACAGRLVFPPHPLPTEVACSLTVEPRGQVVDVGRMVVAPSFQDARHETFVLLLGALYLEVRRRGTSRWPAA